MGEQQEPDRQPKVPDWLSYVTNQAAVESRQEKRTQFGCEIQGIGFHRPSSQSQLLIHSTHLSCQQQQHCYDRATPQDKGDNDDR